MIGTKGCWNRVPLLLILSVGLASAGLRAAAADLITTHREFRAQYPGRQALNRAAMSDLAYWIDRFENELMATPQDPGWETATVALGKVYQAAGDTSAALDAFDAVASSPEAPPDMRLSASLERARSMYEAGAIPEEIAGEYARFEGLVEQFRERSAPYSPVYDEQYIAASRGVANAYMTAAASAGDVDEERALLRSAISYLQQYIDSGDNAFASGESLMGPAPSAHVEMASAYERLAEIAPSMEESVRVRELTMETIRLALNRADVGDRFAVQHSLATALLQHVRELEPAALPVYAQELLETLPPGHHMLNHLHTMGVELSSDETTRDLANDLLDLVLDAEVRWWPDEHESHVNFQWSLIKRGENALLDNDLVTGVRILNQLGSIELRPGFLEEKGQRLVHHLMNALQRIVNEDGSLPTAIERNDGRPQVEVVGESPETIRRDTSQPRTEASPPVDRHVGVDRTTVGVEDEVSRDAKTGFPRWLSVASVVGLALIGVCLVFWLRRLKVVG